MYGDRPTEHSSVTVLIVVVFVSAAIISVAAFFISKVTQ